MDASREISVSEKSRYHRSAKSGTPQSRRLLNERASSCAPLRRSMTARLSTLAGNVKTDQILFIVGV